MLEILHDLAPSAELGFATAFTSDASFADNIRALRFAGGLRRDRRRRPLLQRDARSRTGRSRSRSTRSPPTARCTSARPATRATRSTAPRATTRATSPTPAAASASSPATAHDFDPGPGVQVFEPISPSRAPACRSRCSGPIRSARAANDYDLYLFDAAGNVVDVLAGRPGRRRRPVRDPRHAAAGGAACGSRSCKFRGRRALLPALRARAAASRTRPTGSSRARRPASRAATRRPRTRSARPPRPAAGPLPFDLEPGDPPNPAGPFPDAFTRRAAAGAVHVRRPAARVLRRRRHADHAGRLQLDGRRCGRSRTSRPPTA